MNKIALTLIAVTTMLVLAKSPAFAVTETDAFASPPYGNGTVPFNQFAGYMGSSPTNGPDLALNMPTTLSVAPEDGASNGSTLVDGQGFFSYADNFTHSGLFISNALVSNGSLDADPVLTIN